MILASKLFPEIGMTSKDFVTMFCLFSSFTLGWFILGPVAVERSISVFMLSYMEQNDDKSIDIDDFEHIFYQKYIIDADSFGMRFNEQITSGNIMPVADGDGYIITNNGRFVVNSFRLCAKLFKTNLWLVYPNGYDNRLVRPLDQINEN